MSESPVRQRFTFPGGESLELTPLEAATEFSKRWLPPLNKKSIFVPETIVDHGHTTQAVFLSAEENMQLKSTIKDEKEKEKFHQLTNNHMRGSTSELKVWNYVTNSEAINKTLVTMLLSYKIKNFNLFLNHAHYEGEQEFDIILILPEYKRFVMFEVKSFQETKTLKKPQAQLEKGNQFYEKVIGYLGRETFQSWEFIPVIALPNASSLDRVKCKGYKEIVITQEEMRSDILDVLKLSKVDTADFSEYENLAKLLVASKHFVKVKEENGTINLELNMISATEATHRKQFGVGAEPVTVGTTDISKLTQDLEVKFTSLEKKPFASLESIIFWNREQLDFLHNNHPKILISGSYGTGKTLLLMAKMDMLLRDGFKVAFISFISKAFTKFGYMNSIPYQTNKELESKNFIFNERIKNICKDRNVDFFCPTDIDALKQILIRRKKTFFVMDEVRSDFIKDLASNLEQAVIAMHIDKGDATFSIEENRQKFMKDFDGWSHVNLSIPLRNTTNIQKLNSTFDAKKLNSEDPYFTTLLGPVPKMVICEDKEDAITLGLYHALQQFQGEKKIVIIIKSDILKKSNRSRLYLEWILWRVKKVSGLKVYEFSGQKETCIQWQLFNEAKEGCLVTYDSLFGGMETRNLLYISGKKIFVKMHISTYLLLMLAFINHNYKNAQLFH